jgi:predicted ATPase
MQFTRLHLEKWRNFYEVDVSVRSRAFVVGPNASGKSNLLDAIRFLRDVASVGGGFQEAIQKRGGVSKIRSLSARRYPGVGVSVHIGENGQEDLWQYSLRFTQDNQRKPILTDEEVRRSGEDGPEAARRFRQDRSRTAAADAPRANQR